MKNIILFVWKYSKKYFLIWIFYVVLCCFISGISMLQPIVNGKFIDYLISGINNDKSILRQYVILYIILFVVGIVIGYLVDKVYALLQFKISYNMNMKITRHILKVPFSFVYKKNSVYVSELVNNESSALTAFSLDIIQDIVKNIILIILGFVVIVKHMGLIGSIILFIIPVYYVIYVSQKNKLYEESAKINELESIFFSKLYGLLSNCKFIKINGLDNYFIKKVDDINEQAIMQNMKCKKLKWMYSAYEEGVSTILNIFMVIYLGHLIIIGEMTIGEYTVINSYYVLIIASAKYFFSLGQKLQEIKVSYQRINNLLRIKEENNGSLNIDKIEKIELDKLTFSYINNKLYDEFSVELNKGNVYTILGENGSGKSTLINIIMGLYSEQMQGEIYINNINMKDVNMDQLRKNNIAVAEQDPYLFEDTVLNNIVLDNYRYSKDKLRMLLHYFKLDNVVNKLPLGLNTMICEDVINLSGGEKQKISLIRTFLKESDLIILDEPTNALDMKTKKILIDYIELIKKNKIIIIITHDRDMCGFGDELIRLNNCNS